MPLSTITKYLEEIEPFGATLIAVSKTKSDGIIQRIYDEGNHRDFGENKVQELVGKYERLPKDIRWHMIGHLQRNKVKYIAPFIYLIHSVDSEKLLIEINKEGRKNKEKLRYYFRYISLGKLKSLVFLQRKFPISLKGLLN